MSRKDYRKIAEILHNCKQSYDETDETDETAMWAYIVESLATMLSEDNSRFDRSKFLRACKGEN